MENLERESISHGSSIDFHVDDSPCTIFGLFWEFHVDLYEDLFTLVTLMSNIDADHVVFDCLKSVLI